MIFTENKRGKTHRFYTKKRGGAKVGPPVRLRTGVPQRQDPSQIRGKALDPADKPRDVENEGSRDVENEGSRDVESEGSRDVESEGSRDVGSSRGT
jgi:hypothetical protein